MTQIPSTPQGIVHVVDDDEAARDSLRWLLEANGFHSRAFDGAEAFLTMLERDSTRPANECVIVDVRMPGMSGLELHDELLRRGVTIPLIFITGHGDVRMAVDSMKKGAVDFLEKPFDDTQLCSLVRQCLELAGTQRRDEAAMRLAEQRIERLTLRERQVLDLIVAGRLNKQIADDLGISIKTVEAHRSNIMEKLGTRTMADLMKTVLRAGQRR